VSSIMFKHRTLILECKCLTCQWKLANICILHASSLARAVVINLEHSVEYYDYTVFMSICENNTANAKKNSNNNNNNNKINK
jgi:hypothetical protein